MGQDRHDCFVLYRSPMPKRNDTLKCSSFSQDHTQNSVSDTILQYKEPQIIGVMADYSMGLINTQDESRACYYNKYSRAHTGIHM